MPAFLALLIVMFVTPAFAAEAVKSNLGNVDCGKEYDITKTACVTHTCTEDKDCVNPAAFNGPPGGLPYGCLSDVRVCGWKYPSAQNQNSGSNR